MHSAQLSEICFFEKKDEFWIAYFKDFMQSNRLSNRDIKIELAGGTWNKPRYENLPFFANEIQNEQKCNQYTQALGLILAPVKKLPSGRVYT